MPFKYNFSVASCFKNELPFLEEWLHYHLLVGVQHFYLANNDYDKMPANHLLLPYIKKGIVTLLPECNLKHAHYRSMPRLIKRATGETKWLAVIDVDEFLYPQKFSNNIYRDVVRKFEKNKITGIGINWCLYGTGNNIFHQKLVTQSYLNRAKQTDLVNNIIKLIIRPEYVEESKGHSFYFKSGKVVDTNFKLLMPENDKFKTTEITWNRLRLNHYPLKSLEDFLIKTNRGFMGKRWTINNNTFWSKYFADFNKNDEKDVGMLQYKDQLEASLSSIRNF